VFRRARCKALVSFALLKISSCLVNLDLLLEALQGTGALQRPGEGKGLYPAAQHKLEAQADRIVGIKLGMSCG